MRIRPGLITTRKDALDALCDGLTSTPDCSRLVVVTAPPGHGVSTFLRHLADECAAGGRMGAHQVARLTGLPWDDEPGSTIAPLLNGDASGAATSPSARAAAWIASLAGDCEAVPWRAVVALDDAQYADHVSVQTLVSAAQHADARVLIVVGWCPPRGPGSSTAGDRLFDTVQAAAHTVVHLQPVTMDDVSELAEQRGSVIPSTQIDRLLQHTGGSLRGITEILDTVSATDWSSPYFSLPAPASAARAVRCSLDALTAESRRLVEAVAVLESADRQAWGIDVSEATDVSDLASPAGLVDEALRVGLLVSLDENDAWVRTADPITRRAILDELGQVARSALHEHASRIIDRRAASLRHRWFADPHPDDALATELADLADAEASGGAWANAADLLLLSSRASADADLRGTRLVRAVDALIGAGEIPRASRYLPELESLRESALRNAVLGYLAVVRGRAAEAESRLGRAWELVNPRRDAATASMISQRHVLHHLARCRPRDLVSWADQAIALVDPDEPTAVEAAAIRGLGIAPIAGIHQALDSYRELGGRVPEGAVMQRVVMASGWLLLAADEPERAREALERAVPTDFLGGSLRIALWARSWLARVQFVTGDWVDALQNANAGIELAQRTGMNLFLPLLSWTRAQIGALRGDWDAADRAVRLGEAAGNGYEIMRVPNAIARAAVSEARADYAAVVRTLAPLTQPWAREWVNKPGYWPWTDVYANALVVVGRADEADDFLRHHEELALAEKHQSSLARLSYARGRWHGVRGDLDAARESFGQALSYLELLPLDYDRARVHFAYGQTLRRAGRRADADEIITIARDAYLALGASTYVARCDRELAAGGVNVSRGNRGFDELTPQEEAVSGLVAQGLSNKEVAAELFLSVKTVQYHLTRIYAKLGIRSRSELAARWTR